ncbi:MAG: thioredoxin family protein [Lutibacter sp.]|uniref:thioredoxin family protein n=1 Tax=Lutibacter sp. TaxID=1925666 RepID=UPI0038580E62
MKIIKILGTGCPNCVSTEKIVTEVVATEKIEAQIIKVTDIQEIMMYDIMSTPAVVIDEIVVVKGRVPSASEIKELLKEEACCSTTEDSCCEPVSENKSDSCCEPKNGCC